MTVDRFRRPLLVLSFAIAMFLLAAMPAWADDHEISGRVINLTPDADPPAGLQVVLTIFEGTEPIGQLATTTDENGSFIFGEIPRLAGLGYLFQLQYQGAQYRFQLDPGATIPVQIAIYEPTSELSSLSVLDDTIMVTREPGQYEQLTVRQVVRVRNETLETFVPSFGDAGAGMMNFLRISMPAGFREMTVRSDLQGGQVIPVDRGVGITTAIPPGIHAIVFAYAAPYDQSDLIFEPLYPLGADSVRVLVREDVGQLIGPDIREEESVIVSGSNFRVYSVEEVTAGDRVSLGFTDLPQAPWTTTLADAFTAEWQITAVIPGVTALLLLLFLAYAWRLQKRDPRPVDPAVFLENVQSQPDQMELVERIAELDGRRERGEVSEEDYTQRRTLLKRSLLSRALRSASSA